MRIMNNKLIMSKLSSPMVQTSYFMINLNSDTFMQEIQYEVSVIGIQITYVNKIIIKILII